MGHVHGGNGDTVGRGGRPVDTGNDARDARGGKTPMLLESIKSE